MLMHCLDCHADNVVEMGWTVMGLWLSWRWKRRTMSLVAILHKTHKIQLDDSVIGPVLRAKEKDQKPEEEICVQPGLDYFDRVSIKLEKQF